MQLQQLYYFKEVAERGSINKAADALMMTQPNLSRSIQKLEEELGLELIRRNNRGVQLTEEGRQFYQHAREILDRVEIIQHISKEDSPRMLSVSAFPSLTSTALLEELYARHRNHHIQFTLRESRLSEIISDVHELRSELGVLHTNPTQQKQVHILLEQKQLEFHPVSTDSWYAYLGPNSPFYDQESVSMRELLEYPVLRYPDDYFSILTSYMLIDGDRLHDLTKRVMFLNNEGAIINLLRTTDAFTFGMSWSREFYAELGIACKPIQDYHVEITLGWAKRKKEQLSREGTQFVELLQKHYAQTAQ